MSEQKEAIYITKGIKKIKRPRDVSIGLPPAFKKIVLNVTYHDGTCVGLPINRQVAEVLIARGMATEG